MTDRWDAPRVLLWGTAGTFAYRVFQTLRAANIAIAGVVLPGASGTGWHQHSPPRPPASDVLMLPSFVAHGLVERAWEEAIPVFRCGANGQHPAMWDDTYAAVAEIAPTVIVVACWHTRLPDRLLALPLWGGMNLHPSLLPHFRGPTPLFWQRHAGMRETGITIHAMTHKWDAGNIYLQQALPLPDGATMEVLDTLTGTVGGNLLVQILQHKGAEKPQSFPQPPGGTYQTFPTGHDFSIPASWTGLHTWNFMRAAEAFGMPFTFRGDGDKPPIIANRAVAYHPHSIIPEPSWVIPPHGMTVHFSDGVLVVE